MKQVRSDTRKQTKWFEFLFTVVGPEEPGACLHARVSFNVHDGNGKNCHDAQEDQLKQKTIQLKHDCSCNSTETFSLVIKFWNLFRLGKSFQNLDRATYRH